jgi:putative transposase
VGVILKVTKLIRKDTHMKSIPLDSGFEQINLKEVIETLVNHEFEAYITELKLTEPMNRGKRNGYRMCTIKTLLGKLHIRLPRLRNHNFKSVVIQNFKADDTLIAFASSLYGHGLSTRRISDVLLTNFGLNISKSKVAQYIKVLDADVNKYFTFQASEIDYSVIQIDGKYIRVDETNSYRKSVLLNVIGIDSNGVRRHIHMDVISSEKYNDVIPVLRSLKNRLGDTNATFVIDGNVDLSRSISEVFPTNKIQRCLVHIVRNIKTILTNSASISEKNEMEAELNKLFFNTSCDQVYDCYEAFILKWKKYAKLINPIIRADHIWTYLNISSFEDCKTNNVIEGMHSQLESVLSHHNHFETKESLYRAIISELNRYNNLESTCLEKIHPLEQEIELRQISSKGEDLHRVVLYCNGRKRINAIVSKQVQRQVLRILNQRE